MWPIFIIRSNIASHWRIIPKYGIHPWNNPQDMEQHHWAMKLQVIMTYMYYGGQRSHHTDSLSGNQQSNRLQDISKITEVKNVGHVDLHMFWAQRFSHNDSLSKSIIFIHQIVFKIQETSSPKGNDRSPESNVPSQISFKTSMETSLSHYNSLEYFSNTQGPLIPQ